LFGKTATDINCINFSAGPILIAEIQRGFSSLLLNKTLVLQRENSGTECKQCDGAVMEQKAW
jgi:hypothetical protein